MDRSDAARELMAIYLETKDLPESDQLITRIEKIGALQHRDIYRLDLITRREAIELAHGSMPRELELHRISRAEQLYLWTRAHQKLYPESSTDWLEDIFSLFEWARSNCEEGGELGCDWVLDSGMNCRTIEWVREPIRHGRSPLFKF